MAIFETILFTINMHIGYVLFGAIDVGETLSVERPLSFIQMSAGGSIFVHAFGAYFGIMVGITMMFRNYDYTEDKQGTTSTTDVFSLLGLTSVWTFYSG